jgi:hypothetical protein
MQLLNAATAGMSQWTASAAGGVTLSNIANGGNINFSAAGNFLITPNASGNILELTQGVPLCVGGGPWQAVSDARIKTVEAEYILGLDEVLALRPIVYRYKGNARIGSAEVVGIQQITDKAFVGLVAQEVETIMPGMVEQRAGTIDGEPVTDLRTLNNGELIYALVNAVKTLAARVEALEAAR